MEASWSKESKKYSKTFKFYFYFCDSNGNCNRNEVIKKSEPFYIISKKSQVEKIIQLETVIEEPVIETTIPTRELAYTASNVIIKGHNLR